MLENEIRHGARAMHPVRITVLVLAVLAIVGMMLLLLWTVWMWAYGKHPSLTLWVSVMLVTIVVLAYLCVPASKPGEE